MYWYSSRASNLTLASGTSPKIESITWQYAAPGATKARRPGDQEPRRWAVVSSRGPRRPAGRPQRTGAALLDLGVVELQEAVEPLQQFLPGLAHGCSFRRAPESAAEGS